MKAGFSFAVCLHRVFDSVAPEKPAAFFMEGCRLSPYQKPGGLYVFADTPPGRVVARCGGYQEESLDCALGSVNHCFLYPDALFVPPAGWMLESLPAPPGEIRCWIDNAYELLVLETGQPKTARIRACPVFSGGCILLLGEGASNALFVLERRGDCYWLSQTLSGWSGKEIRRCYAGRAPQNGLLTVVYPQTFSFREKDAVNSSI